MSTLIVATHNAHKLREIGELLPGWEIRGEDSGAEETAETFSGNARIKARAIALRHPGAWVMADDSGLEVDALGGAPGVRSARYAGRDGDTPANNERPFVLVRLADGMTMPMGAFFVPEPYRQTYWRCDLHARYRPDGKQIGFNSVHEGSRQVYLRDIK